MAQDDYFSFGDEELDAELDLPDLWGDSPDQAVALAEPPDGDEFGTDGDWFGSPTERAARPRGDSKNGSSERRLPSSRRTRVLAALALGLLILFLGRTVIATLGGDEPAVQNASTNMVRPTPPSTADLETRRRAEATRASRERAAEGQSARQHRTQTRRRARRRRQRIGAERQQRAKARRTQAEAQEKASAAAEVPIPDVPPSYGPPPPSSPTPEPAPEPPSEPHIQSGANSPEFGL